MVRRMSSNERFGVLKVAPDKLSDLEIPLGKIGKEEAAKLYKGCLADRSRPNLCGEDRLDFDEGKP